MIDYIGEIPALNLYNRHIRPIEIKQKMKHEDNFNSYFKFAFVRNTWDWHVSQFHFHKQNKRFGYFHDTFKHMSFEEYIEWAVLENNIIEALSAQKRFLSDNNGNLMVDFVGKFENLSCDFKNVCKKLNIDTQLTKKNPSKRKKSYRDYYSDYTRNIIANTFQEDIDFFNFKF